MIKIYKVLLILALSILFLPQNAFATESSITLLPGHNYVIEGIGHRWTEELYGVQPENLGFPIKNYVVGELKQGTTYDLYTYDWIDYKLSKNITSPLGISFEIQSWFDESLYYTLKPGGKTYFTISPDSPQTELKYRSDIVLITETDVPALYTGTLEPGKTYEFVHHNLTPRINGIDYYYVMLAFENEVSLNVNGELKTFKAFSADYLDHLGIDDILGTGEKTIVTVPPSAKATKYYAPGENFKKYVTVSEKSVSNNIPTINQAIKVHLDDVNIDFDVPPTIVEGRTLVPLRAIFMAMGAEIKWDDTTKTVTAVKDDVTVVLTIGNNTAFVNGNPITLDVPGTIVKSRTMVPAKFIAEALGANVVWNGDTKTVLITTK